MNLWSSTIRRLAAAATLCLAGTAVAVGPATSANALGRPGTFEVKNVATGLCLVADYAATYSWPCGTYNQRWIVRRADTPDQMTYTMQNLATRQCLAADKSGQVFTVTFCDPEDRSQQWYTYSTGCPGYFLQNVDVGLFLSTDFSRDVYLAGETHNQRWYDPATTGGRNVSDRTEGTMTARTNRIGLGCGALVAALIAVLALPGTASAATRTTEYLGTWGYSDTRCSTARSGYWCLSENPNYNLNVGGYYYRGTLCNNQVDFPGVFWDKASSFRHHQSERARLFVYSYRAPGVPAELLLTGRTEMSIPNLSTVATPDGNADNKADTYANFCS
jgi:hypothetical protein